MGDKPIEYERSVLEAVVEASDVGILVVDDERTFFTYNDRFVDMWGIPEEIVTAGDDEAALDAVLGTLEHPEDFLENVEYFYEHPTETSHDRILLEDGRTFHRYTAPITGDDGTYYGRLWRFRDITERIRHEEQLKRQKERLEEYADTISHDLRNPLNVARGHVDLARDGDVADHLDTIEANLERMQTLIDDLLDAARAGESITAERSIELDDCASEAWRTVETSEATIQIETTRSLRGDPARLKQLLENAFRNSIEHTDGSVTITVDDLSDGFYVEDDGPGFPDREREQLVASGFSTRPEGTGLGLSIVSQVADAHDWDIDLCDGENGGARIEVIGIE